MPSRPLPNLLLQAFFDLGEDGWKDEMDLNMLKLSVLVQGGVSDKVAAEPGAPADGDVVVLDETHATHPNKIAVYDDGAWVYFEPSEGWLVYDRTANAYISFTGAVWDTFAGGGGGGGSASVQTEAADYTLAPGDDGNYIRLTAAGTKDVDIATDATTALPANGEWHIRNAGAGDATIVPAGGVTVNPPAGGTLVLEEGMTVTLKRVAADEFDLLGQTVPL